MLYSHPDRPMTMAASPKQQSQVNGSTARREGEGNVIMLPRNTPVMVKYENASGAQLSALPHMAGVVVCV